MIERRPFNQLVGEDRRWLRAKRHISFAHCHDATRVGCGSLRVWKDDEIAPNAGFSPHPHADIRAHVSEGGQAIEYALDERRHAYLVPASVNGVRPSTRPVGLKGEAFHGKVGREKAWSGGGVPSADALILDVTMASHGSEDARRGRTARAEAIKKGIEPPKIVFTGR